MYRNQILSNPAELGRLLRGKEDRLLIPNETTPYLIISNSHQCNYKMHRQKQRLRQRQRRKARRRETGRLKDGERVRSEDAEMGNGKIVNDEMGKEEKSGNYEMGVEKVPP